MSTDLRAAARRIAGRSYRKAGELGRRLLGDDGPTAADLPPSAPHVAAEPAPVGPHPDPACPPWLPLPESKSVICNICKWSGDAFATEIVEPPLGAVGSIGRVG